MTFRIDRGSNILFNHSMFSYPEFLNFEDFMLATLQIAQEPVDMILQQAMLTFS
jgi:hypothetical protein